MKTVDAVGPYGRTHKVFDVLVGFPAEFIRRTMCGQPAPSLPSYVGNRRTPCPDCAAAIAAGEPVQVER